MKKLRKKEKKKPESLTSFNTGDRVMPVGHCKRTANLYGWNDSLEDNLYRTGTVIKTYPEHSLDLEFPKSEITMRVGCSDVIKIEDHPEKYALLKAFTGEIIYECDPCTHEFEKFIEIYGFFNLISSDVFDDFINFAITQEGWIEFLSDNDFISIEDPDKPVYNIGDVFKIKGSYYMLSNINDYMVILIAVQSDVVNAGNYWMPPVTVNDATTGVTQNEFKAVAGFRWDEFKFTTGDFEIKWQK